MTACSDNSEIATDATLLQVGQAHRERQIDAIRRISNALFSHTSADEMVRETLTVGIEVLRADAGSLLMHEPHSDSLIFRYVIGPAAASLTDHAMPSSQGIAGRVFTTGQSDLTQKVQERVEFDRSVDEKTGYLTESMMTVPMRRPDGALIGVMQVLNASEPFDEYDLEVLEVLCSQAAVAIENARLLREARKAQLVNVIGDISHDIKNMLTPIQSGVWTLQPMLDEMMEGLETLCRKCPDPEWRKELEDLILLVGNDYAWILENALDAADKVQARTREIADTIKGEAAPPFFEKSNLNDTAHEVMRALHLVAQNCGVQLRLQLDPALPLAQLDRKQMYNALYNLVNNAIPETPRGGSVTVFTHGPDVADEGTLILKVVDTGRGMPEKVRQKLFTEEAISTKPGGTGLGTAIVAGVVQRHHGTISVNSEEGWGSTFIVRLPLEQQIPT